MRIRSVKPEFWTSESMGRVSRDARLLFVGLWSLADDEGRTRAASRMLASLLYPYDEDARGLVDGWLAELDTERCIHRYCIDGNHYLQVCNWLVHQKIDHPSKSKLPPPPETSRNLAKPREPSGEDQGSGIRDQGSKPPTPNGAEDVGCADAPEDKAPDMEPWKALNNPENIASFIRILTTADPTAAQLAVWHACMADLARRHADPAKVAKALNAFREAKPEYRGTLPEARRLSPDWFLGLVTKYGPRQI